nr:MAG TPA: hypothetical protein [Caudoviricetes sp.]
MTINWKRLIREATPYVLTGSAIVGIAVTAMFTAKGALRAQDILIRNEACDAAFKRKVQLTWKEFVPALSAAAVTGACIVGLHGVLGRRIASIAAATTVVETQLNKLKTAVKDVATPQLREEIQNAAARPAAHAAEVPVVADDLAEGSQLCFEAYSGRYFIASMEDVRGGINDVNAQINSNFYASLNDLYDALGLERLRYGDDVGWNTDSLIEPCFSADLTPDGRPYLVLDYQKAPSHAYDRLY